MRSSSFMNRLSLSWISVALYVVCFICSNILVDANLTSARLDLTQDRTYTISEATKQILEEIKEPIKLRLYSSAGIEDNILPAPPLTKNAVFFFMITYNSFSV